MIIQENDFVRAYNDTDKLWEDIETILSGITLKRNFQHPDQLISSIPSRTSGIYLIKYEHPEDGPQYYVGKSVDIKYRTHVHFDLCPLRDSRLLHLKIKRHYKQTVPERFSIATLEEGVAIEELNELEIHWIKTLDTYHLANKTGGLNLTRGGDGGGRGTVTPKIYMSIIDMLENTEKAIADIAREHKIDRKNVYLINHGWHWLSTSDRAYPIRSEEQNKEYGQRATDEANIANAELPHIVCLDRNNNYYYFPNTTKAAEFAVINGFYSSGRIARDKIKLRGISAENLDDFKDKSKNAFIGPGTAQRQLYWGILKAVPNKDTVSGGFSGEEIINDQGQVLGLKFN